MPEQQNVEYKASWWDEYLKWICRFANAQGGQMFIGIDDKGNVMGVENYKKQMDEIPNKAINHLSLIVNVNLLNELVQQQILKREGITGKETSYTLS